jgi:hypothetical protein
LPRNDPGALICHVNFVLVDSMPCETPERRRQSQIFGAFDAEAERLERHMDLDEI